MKNIAIMVKPASSRCNMRCKYCYYADEASHRTTLCYGMMDVTQGERLAERLMKPMLKGDQLTIAFQGGEPTLVGLQFYDALIKRVNALNHGCQVSYSIQTNGLTLDDEWYRFLKEKRFLVGLSFDLLPDANDAVRVDAKGQGTTNQVLSAMRRLKGNHVSYNVLCTLTEPIAKHPRLVWKAMEQYGIDYIQFTPCMAGLSNPEKAQLALHTETLGRFYISLFSDWLEAYQGGRYVSIKLFDDLVNYIAFSSIGMCGLNGKCMPQLVIEGDGRVYPCDFYCLDEYEIGNFFNDEMEELYLRSAKLTLERNARPMDPKCRECRYMAFCGGGCRRMHDSFVGISGDISNCGMRSFLDQCGKALTDIARCQRKLRGF